jgi:hypothetical protein
MGGIVFAATMMVVVGIFQIFQGIAAIAQENFFVLGANYFYDVDTNVWGWIHLGIGVLLVLAGMALFTGALWARAVGIFIAAVSAIANFFFVPYYPLWALLIIAVDVYLIWAIANAGRDFAAYSGESGMSRTGAYSGEAGRTGAERWPATNEPAGRDWAPEHAKEGTAGTDESTRQAAERAAEEARRQSRR